MEDHSQAIRVLTAAPKAKKAISRSVRSIALQLLMPTTLGRQAPVGVASGTRDAGCQRFGAGRWAGPQSCIGPRQREEANAWPASATAIDTDRKKPITVKRPANLPACSYDSGIIELVSITRIAPPAKA